MGESSINDFGQSLEYLSYLLGFATFLVVLGLILEYGYDIPEAWKERRTWSWEPLITLIGGLLIRLTYRECL